MLTSFLNSPFFKDLILNFSFFQNCENSYSLPVYRKRKISNVGNKLRPIWIPSLLQFLSLCKTQTGTFTLTKGALLLQQQLPIFPKMCKLEYHVDSPESTWPNTQDVGIQLHILSSGRKKRRYGWNCRRNYSMRRKIGQVLEGIVCKHRPALEALYS